MSIAGGSLPHFGSGSVLTNSANLSGVYAGQHYTRAHQTSEVSGWCYAYDYQSAALDGSDVCVGAS